MGHMNKNGNSRDWGARPVPRRDHRPVADRLVVREYERVFGDCYYLALAKAASTTLPTASSTTAALEQQGLGDCPSMDFGPQQLVLEFERISSVSYSRKRA